LAPRRTWPWPPRWRLRAAGRRGERRGAPKAEAPSQQPEGEHVVVIKTNYGEIRVELLADQARSR
jgi:hypothetical protein